jgi:hypothetical protein
VREMPREFTASTQANHSRAKFVGPPVHAGCAAEAPKTSWHGTSFDTGHAQLTRIIGHTRCCGAYVLISKMPT